MRAPSTRAAPFVLAGFVLAAAIVLALLGRGIATPWILIDELLHAELARARTTDDGAAGRRARRHRIGGGNARGGVDPRAGAGARRAVRPPRARPLAVARALGRRRNRGAREAVRGRARRVRGEAHRVL